MTIKLGADNVASTFLLSDVDLKTICGGGITTTGSVDTTPLFDPPPFQYGTGLYGGGYSSNAKPGLYTPVQQPMLSAKYNPDTGLSGGLTVMGAPLSNQWVSTPNP
jgi:hypothetical protein